MIILGSLQIRPPVAPQLAMMVSCAALQGGPSQTAALCGPMQVRQDYRLQLSGCETKAALCGQLQLR
eukprot:559745-Pelagomonas_calceolata.AAC.3